MKRGVWNWLFLISVFSTGLFSGVLIWQQMFPEWRGYQAEYYRRLAQVTGDPAKARTPLAIRQIYLPEMHRTDRCITCHVGVDNPKMADQPEPFRTHPDMGDPSFLATHPFTEMGCTVCHHGQGSATIKEHAHGRVAHWEEPLLPKDLTISTCAVCHQNVMDLKQARPLVEAKALMDEKGCLGCHALNGAGQQLAPELSETAHKATDELDFRHVNGEHTVHNWIYDHFKDPQRVMPGDSAQGIPESAMPNFELSEEETVKLTALILSFAEAKGDEGHPIPSRFRVAAAPTPAPPPVTYASPAEKGAAVFKKYGCAACHGIGGRGGVRSKNMYPGEEEPPLIYIGGGYTKEEIKEVIRKGRYPARADSSGPSPVLWMPAWKDRIPEDEIDALADYLLSLYPEPGQQAVQPVKK